MKKMRYNNDSQYIHHYNNKLYKTSSWKKIITIVFSSIFAISFLMTGTLSLLSTDAFTHIAKADDDDEDKAKEKIQEAADAYIPSDGEGEDKFWKTLEKSSGDTDENTFASVVNRLFTSSYMNYTGNAVAASGQQKRDYNCNVNDSKKNTPLYHNCDVPNIMTEFSQDFLSMIIQTGPQGAETESAKLDSPWFGLPSNLPAGGASINPDERSVKYTGLELYGYNNLKYTSYAGEWDHIKVMTSARTLSNFGIMDDIKVGIGTVINGVKGGIQQSASNVAENLKSGNVFGAIGGAFSGFAEGGISSSINTVLDTSDLNVFNTNAWYRVGYGATLYNARELNQEELAAKAQAQMISLIRNGSPDKAKVPDDLQKIKNGPKDPKEDISQCIIVNGKNQRKWGDTSKAPGPTEESCKNEAKNSTGNANNARWSINGTQKKDTLKKWKEDNKSIFDTADKYNLNCSIDTDESTRKDSLASFKACWTDAWPKAADKAKVETQTNNNNDWMSKIFDVSNIATWITKNPEVNFNAPWNRYVCLDSNGKDMRDSNNNFVMLYDQNGNLNSSCNPVRSPIQNGFFGNGYKGTSENPAPAMDTRYEKVDTSIIGSMFPIQNLFTAIGNFGLYIAVFMTRVSNTVINLSFSPILSTLGIDKIVISLIEGFRDSIFFPLVPLLVAIAGIMVLWSAGKNRDYGRQAISILLITGTIVGGVFLMYRPAQTIKLVDDVPARIESAVVGSIFGFGNNNDDELCTASGTVSEGKSEGLNGEKLAYGPSEGTRSLMCENWRAFAFNPWVYGQWGTNYTNLYANSTSNPQKMHNTNSNLVGNADVKMGNNTTVNNWALYQLSTMSSGTASNSDPSLQSGFINRNFYRLVDLQAGPDNGKGTDGRFFNAWSGHDGASRSIIGIFSASTSVIAAITIITYSVAKILIAFTTIMLLMILPFMFLMGVHPTIGRMKLKSYFGQLVGLMIQRVILIVLMSVMFRIVVAFGDSSSNYMLSGLACMLICIVFLMIRKPLLNMVFSSMSTTFGQPIGQRFWTNPRQSLEELSNRRIRIPGSGYIANKWNLAKRGAQGAASGAIGGYMSGGVGKAFEGAKQSAKYETNLLKNQQRRRGFGIPQTMSEGAKAGIQTVADNVYSNKYAEDARKKIIKNTDEAKIYHETMKVYDKLPNKVDQNGEVVLDSRNNPIKYNSDTGEDIIKPSYPKLRSANRAGTLRAINKIAKAQQELDELHIAESKQPMIIINEKTQNNDNDSEVFDDSNDFDNDNNKSTDDNHIFNDISNDSNNAKDYLRNNYKNNSYGQYQEHQESLRNNNVDKKDRLQRDIDTNISKVSQYEDHRAVWVRETRDMVKSLDELRKRAEKAIDKTEKENKNEDTQDEEK